MDEFNNFLKSLQLTNKYYQGFPIEYLLIKNSAEMRDFIIKQNKKKFPIQLILDEIVNKEFINLLEVKKYLLESHLVSLRSL